MQKLLFSMSAVNDLSTIIAVNWLPSVRVTSAINTMTSDYRIAEAKHVGTTSEQVMKEAEAEMQKLKKDITAARSEYEKLISSPEEKAL